jgi:hypothetical protein
MTWEDGTIQLIAANGSWFSIDTSTLRDGEALSAALLQALPAEYVIPMD